ncbi:MAG: sensor histidine kinase [Terriglobia bacterium]
MPKEDFPTRKVIATGVPVLNNEFVLERPDAKRLNILTSIMPLRSENMIVGAVAVVQDVTAFKRVHLEREALMKELERSNSELSVFSHAVAHDLLAPVRGVRAFTELLSRSDPASERASEFLAQIKKSVEGMTDLVDALLRYAQVGQGEANREPVQVNGILEEVALTLEPVIKTTEARLVYRSLPVVEADPVLLQQLFQNLVSNAIRYRNPNRPPVIEVTGEKTAEGWAFAVKDNGQGIPKEYHTYVFEPLKRLHGSEAAGTGLGLSLCRSIVVRHGGRIWVESDGAGTGTTLRFTLASTMPLSSAATGKF